MAQVIVNNTKYTPFTFDEMLKPVLIYKDAYEKTEQDYEELLKNTSEWENTVRGSSMAKEMYDSYYGELNAAMDSFSKGMSAQNRKELLRLKRDYYKRIAPISKAAEMVKERQALETKAGSDAIFVQDRFTIDDALQGVQVNNAYQSKSGITKETAALTDSIISEMGSTPIVRQVAGSNGQFLEIVQQPGGSIGDLQRALEWVPGMELSEADMNNRFIQAKQRMLTKTGYDYHGNVGKQQLLESINQGLYLGLPKQSSSIQRNSAFKVTAGNYSGGKYKSDKDSNDGSTPNSSSSYVSNNIIVELDAQGNAGAVQNQDPNEPHGYYTDYDDLNPRGQIKAWVDKYLEDSDRNQYEIYTWTDANSGRTRIQIRRKQPPVKKGASESNNVKQVDPDAL